MDNEANKGPFWGTIVIILIIIVGGLYVFWTRSKTTGPTIPNPPDETATTTTTATTSANLNLPLPPQGDSVSNLEDAVNALDPRGVDADLPALEKNL